MHKINLTGALQSSERYIETAKYDALKRKTSPNWSDCLDEEELLVKLHYLRTLFKEKKLDYANFAKREERLVTKWWLRFCR